MSECVVCGKNSDKPLYDGILKCCVCGHIYSDISLRDKDIFRLYGESYFFGDEYNNYLAEQKVLLKNFKLRLKILRTLINSTYHKNLLEIGCAYGFFLSLAAELFNTAQGVDICETGIRYAQENLKLDVINADFLKHDFGYKKYDVVCLWDTIEHLRSPQLYLEKASTHMSSGSFIAITTGDIDSLNAKIKKNKWRMIHPPTHIHYFSKKTLGKMLNNYGFEIVYNRYCGFYRSIDLIAYRTLALNKKCVWLYDALRKTKIADFNVYLNLYDIMYVIARKR